MTRSSSIVPVFAIAALTCGAFGCGQRPAAGGPAVRFDPCSPLTLIPDPGATDAQTQGIAAGLALWKDSAETDLALGLPGAGGEGPSLPVHFQAAAAPFHGLYDPARAEVFINDDLSGNEQAIAIAHEIGHAFGLVHVSTGERLSLMNPDNLAVPPTAADVGALAVVWSRCGQLDATMPE